MPVPRFNATVASRLGAATPLRFICAIRGNMSSENWNKEEWVDLPSALRVDWILLAALLLAIGATWTHVLSIREGVHVTFLFMVLLGVGTILSTHTSPDHRKWYYCTRWANAAFGANWAIFPLFAPDGTLSDYSPAALWLTAATGIYFLATLSTNLYFFWASALRRHLGADNDQEESRALQAAVDKSLGNLQKGFSNLQRSISAEAADLQRAYQQVKLLLDKQSAELRRTQHTLATDREELRKLRLLLDSPREQVELLTRKVRSKSTAREIGSFAIGVLASLSATELHPIIKQLFQEIAK